MLLGRILFAQKLIPIFIISPLTFNLFYAIIVNDMERVWSTLHRGFSVRSVFMFVLTVFIAALLVVAFGSHTQTHALDDETATWTGDSITYHGHTYNPNNDAEKDNTLGIPVGSHYYSYAPETDSSTGTQVKTVKAFVIYFTPGTDPPTATTATLVTYDYSPAKGYSNPSDKKAITVTVKGEESSYSSCSVEGIGYIICPVTVFLANGMDFIFQKVAGFMAVQPVTVTDSTSSLHIAWSIMRTIANVAFIIVFLIIIYSQLTSTAVSNYGIKKLLPRLIVAALLVNLSYIICALAIDISNIFGYSLQEIFVNIRQNTFSITNDTWSNSTTAWSTITTAILGGVGLGVLIADPAVLFLLIPVLVGVLLTAIFVLLILAARQAIIVILIIIAPLAFVAYLLPNTEQWFKKWRELFMTMLIFFPAFSLVFGGSQLASSIILQNASSMLMVVMGLAVQVAPLVITPLILRFSGGVLGKIAGLVNNPKKGVMDRTNNWAKSRAERGRNAMLANSGTKNPFRKVAQGFAYRNRRVEKDTERYKAQIEDWSSKRDVATRRGQEIEVETALAKLSTEETHHDTAQAMEEARAGSDAGLRRLRLQDGVTITERVRARMNDTTVEDMRQANYTIERDAAGNVINPNKYTKYAEDIMHRAVHLDQGSRVIETATAIAKNKQLTEYAAAVEKNTDGIRNRAGGIGGTVGAQGALAAALKAQASAHVDAVSNANSILTRYNYGDDVIVEFAKGKKPVGLDINFELTPTIEEAAIMKIAGSSNAKAILDLMQNIEINPSDENQDFRQTYADTLGNNGAKPKFAGAGIIASTKQGDAPAAGKARIDNYIAQTINANKFSAADVLVSQDNEYLIALQKTLANNESGVRIEPEKKMRVLKAIRAARANPIYEGRIAERDDTFTNIERLIASDPEVASLPEDPPATT